MRTMLAEPREQKGCRESCESKGREQDPREQPARAVDRREELPFRDRDDQVPGRAYDQVTGEETGPLTLA